MKMGATKREIKRVTREAFKKRAGNYKATSEAAVGTMPEENRHRQQEFIETN